MVIKEEDDPDAIGFMETDPGMTLELDVRINC